MGNAHARSAQRHHRALFDELADLYELDGAVVHRVLAYRNAAKSVREAPRSVAAMTREGKVTELPGIGRTLEEKIEALLETGTIPAVEKLRAHFPAGLVDLTRLPGLGPKRARKLYDELGIDSLESLRAAAEGEKLRDVRGFGAKFEESVLEAFAAGVGEAPEPRVLLNKALEIGEGIVEALRAHPRRPDRVELAGSARRLADAVKDLDIIATASDPPALLAAFAALDVIESAASPGENAARARTHTGAPVDLRVVEPDQFGNLLQHFTGSKAHNLALREAAVRRGLHVSEYGLLDDATGETHRCATEEEVYALLGLPWIPPELRENRGELALTDGELPALIEQGDLKGDLHMHTTLSDGRADAEAMAVRARELRPRVHRDHRPLGHARLRQPRHARCAARADRGGPRARRAHGGHPRAHRHRDEHRHRRHARTTTTTCWRSSTGSSARSTRRSHSAPMR